MTNKLTRLNIISKLNFENITTTQNFANIINDNNPYTKLTWNTFSSSATMQCIVSDNIKYANLSNNYNRFRTQISYFNDRSFNFIIKFRLTELRSIQNIVTINNGTTHFVCNIKNTFDNGLSLYNSNGAISINCNYKFEADIDYVISISKDEDIYKVIINGTQYLCTENISFKNNLPSSDNSYLILGCVDINPSNNINGLRGRLYWANLSIGPTMIFNGSYTKYGSSLKSFLYFGNKAINDTATSYYAPLEAIEDSIITWNGLETINDENINQDKLICTGTNSFYTNYNINNPFTLTFKYRLNEAMEDVELISYYGYKLLVTNVVNDTGIPDYPEVLVNEYTTSGLDFETGLTDKIPTTIWNKEGTADITSINKIFGNNSFETKALGDSLYTNSNIITGGATPFTIEFYALIKGRHGYAIPPHPLLTQSKNIGDGEQFLNIGENGFTIYNRSPNNTPALPRAITSKTKTNFNEIKKYTLSYDGSALRMFIDDKLEDVIGVSSGWNISSEPLRFFDIFVPSYSSYRYGTKGLIDNINIHDGIATKVRDYDPYEEYLVVDLAFDGENNSTKIVDNGSLKSNWTVNGNAKISTIQKFDGFSSLYLDGNDDYIYNNKPFNLGIEDFTISCSFISFSNDVKVRSIVRTVSSPNNPYSFYIGIENDNTLKFLLYDYEVTQALLNKSSNTIIQINKEYKVDVICKNNVVSMYINGIIEYSESISTRQDIIPQNLLYIGYSLDGSNDRYFNGYIKNFKIYKGVAVIPEDPTGKIQLDFDNNVIDKYGNSTWTNNGVTFDQVNSVKGHAAKFGGGQIVTSGQNSNLNFENKNFYYSLDLKSNRYADPYGSGILSNNYTSNQSDPERHALIHSNTNGALYSTNGASNGYVSNNTFYNILQGRINSIAYAKTNGVLTGVKNILPTTTYNYNYGNNTFIGLAAYYYTLTFDGYIDNFKSVKDYQGEVIIDRPAVHLPLETNAINTGFTSLTINSVGNPTYHVVDGKKCIKFESGKYLTINSNNIFNLSTNSDFYIEFDFYKETTSNSVIYDSWSHGGTFQIMINNNMLSYYYDNYISTDIPVYINMWYKVKFYRKNAVVVIQLNDEIYTHTSNFNIYGSNTSPITLGCQYQSTSYAMSGYMTNFKMFVGTSEIPETYNDKKVLDLDFKPTGKSYLFKDNNNKCVIHPVNITQRDYQDSQYCCTFNGTNQYLQLGKNELFNFGLDDFVIEIKFTVDSFHSSISKLLLSSGETNGVVGRGLISIESTSASATRPRSLQILTTNSSGSSVGLGSSNDVLLNEINRVIITKNSNTLTINLNDVVTTKNDFNEILNFNLNNNTYIGWRNYQSQIYFNGTIYSIKVLRNTADLSLLNDPVNTPVITPVETIYTLTDGTNTETISLTPELSDNEVTFYNKEFFIDVKVNDDNNVMSLPKNTSIIDNTLTINNGFKGYIKDIKFYDTVIPFNDSDSFIDYDPYNTEFNQVQVEIISDDFTELNTLNIGNNNITGFLEGCILPISYDIIHKSTGAILTSGDTPYYSYNNIDIRYIDEYVIIDSNNKEYELINKSLDKEGFLIFILDAQSCQGNFCIRLYKHLTGKFVGEYEIINNQCQIDYLFIDERYDAVLFDRDSNIESKTLSDRIPEIKIV